jgi:hypothetical protein
LRGVLMAETIPIAIDRATGPVANVSPGRIAASSIPS